MIGQNSAPNCTKSPAKFKSLFELISSTLHLNPEMSKKSHYGASWSHTVLWPKREARWKDIYYNSGLIRGGRVQFKQLLNLDGHSTEYGPLNWLIIAHKLTEIHDTEYYYHEMTDT